MSSDFLIVHKKILPDYLDKVIYARDLLESREVQTITEAVQKAGISRNTFYKYKDYVFPRDESAVSRHAVISLILKDESGSLSSVINCLTDRNTSILTISQSIPIAGKANVLISLDTTNMNGSIDELTDGLRKLKSVRSVHLDAVD